MWIITKRMSQGRETVKTRRARFEHEALPHLDALYSAAMRLARDPARAGELVRETLTRAYRSFDQRRPGGDCRAWLMTILYGDEFRSGRRGRPRVSLSPAADRCTRDPHSPNAESDGPHEHPDSALSQKILDHHVAAAFDSLTSDLRKLLILIDVEQLSYRQAARVLGCPLATVRSRVSRARRMVRKALHESANRRGIDR